MSPPGVQQLLPLVEQLRPLYVDVAQGQQAFIPPVAEVQRMVQNYYNVKRTLLVRFGSDSLDQTPQISLWLQNGALIREGMDLTILGLHGDHLRPLRQPVPEVPSDLREYAGRGGDLLSQLAVMA
eukprot:gene24774-30175_t